MILFIVTDSPTNARSAGFYDMKCKLEDLAEDCCVLLRYDQVTLDLLAKLEPWAIFHSGGSACYDEYDILQCREYRAVVTEWDGAQIGFCGGHQLIAHMFGSTLGHMRQLREDEPDLGAGYHPGWYKEWGIFPVRIVKRDPLFDGLTDIIRVQEYHMDEVKELSSDLELLASSENCRVQAFVHKDRPIYGVQFHPEQPPASYPDGTQILQNFIAIARQYAQRKLAV